MECWSSLLVDGFGLGPILVLDHCRKKHLVALRELNQGIPPQVMETVLEEYLQSTSPTQYLVVGLGLVQPRHLHVVDWVLKIIQTIG